MSLKSPATSPAADPKHPTAADPKHPTAAGAKRQASREALSQTVAAAAGLLEEGDRAHAGIAGDARDLLLDEIVPDPQQPRRHFDDAELRALADDIGRRGVLQPILVRPPAEPGAPFRLVAGERRWRAARMAGKVRIPARIREIDDDDVQAAQLAENILRAGLTDIEKGRALRRLYEIRKFQNYKTTWENIADEVGLGRARINDLFSLASLPEPVAALIAAGRLTGSHGILLQRVQSSLGDDDVLTLARQAARPEGKRSGGYALTVSRLRHLIQEQLAQRTVAPSGMRVRESAPAVTPPALRPFVRRTLEAVTAGKLSAEERGVLLQALSQEPPDKPRAEKITTEAGRRGAARKSGEERGDGT